MTNKSPEHVLYTITKLNALICALQILYYKKQQPIIKKVYNLSKSIKYDIMYIARELAYIKKGNI